jgi:hypothetical protein
MDDDTCPADRPAAPARPQRTWHHIGLPLRHRHGRAPRDCSRRVRADNPGSIAALVSDWTAQCCSSRRLSRKVASTSFRISTTLPKPAVCLPVTTRTSACGGLKSEPRWDVPPCAWFIRQRPRKGALATRAAASPASPSRRLPLMSGRRHIERLAVKASPLRLGETGAPLSRRPSRAAARAVPLTPSLRSGDRGCGPEHGSRATRRAAAHWC